MAKGRPSSFKQETADEICERIATSKDSLRKICLPDNMPNVSTVLKWLRDFPEFLAQYARAKEEQADFLAEELLEIADDRSEDVLETEDGQSANPVAVQRAKLRVDARKWAASKLKPKKYGDKLDMTTDGDKLQQGAVSDEQFNALLNAARQGAKADKGE